MSGASALAWQGLWISQWGVALGHDWAAALALTGALFLGWALGSAILGPRIERSAKPHRWFALLEAVVGLWGLVVCLLMPLSLQWWAKLIGPSPGAAAHAGWALAAPALVLWPCMLAMGASLPALVQMDAKAARAARAARDASRSGTPPTHELVRNPSPLSRTYAAHTAGALAGVLLAVFLLIPSWGVGATAGVAALVNVVCAVLALQAARLGALCGSAQPAQLQAARSQDQPVPSPSARGRAWVVPTVLGMMGLAGIGYETLCIRVLSQVTESTVYSFALVLSVYLLGTAAGAALAQRAGLRSPRKGLLLCAAAVASGCWALGNARALGPALWPGASAAGLGPETVMALAALLLPAVAMGAAFTACCQWAQDRGVRLSRALALNTAGAALAPALVGFLAIPAWGSGPSAMMMVATYCMLAALPASAAKWRLIPAGAAGLLALGVVWAGAREAWPLQAVDLKPGDTLVSHEEGPAATVSIVQDALGVLRLHINGRVQEGSSAASPVETRLALLPMALQPQGGKALFLGLGTGYTARVAALDARWHVDAVELLPEVVSAATRFGLSPAFPRPEPGPRVITADARRFVLAGDERYNLIVADLFHPARSGAGSLYTVEHFSAMGERLAPGGLVCQWIALHQMELSTLKPIVAAFLQAFPGAAAVLASNSLETPVLGLIARPDGPWADRHAIGSRLRGWRETHLPWLEQARLVDGLSVLGSLVAGPSELARWVHDVAPNRDDRPRVAYAAPWDTYAPRTSPRARLGALLAELGDLSPEALARLLPAGEDVASLAAYIQARNRYLQLGLGLPAGVNVEQVRETLTPALQLLLSRSPDFMPAVEALRALRQAPNPVPETSLPSPSR